ncbi:MAG TPA: DUF4157 domain-containing protein [Terriglobales bacterium]
MREHQNDTSAESSLHGLVVRERHGEEAPIASHQNPLAHLANRAPSAASARAHSSALNRETASQPARASGSILQLQRQYGNHYVQRVLALARHGEGEADVAPEVESAIERSRGGAQGLDHSVRRKMESAFGADFSGVRIHTGAEAHSLNRAVNAIAFTTGQDIFFRDGAYSPHSSDGRQLLAHELTHVVQQSAAPTAPMRAQHVGVQRLCPECDEEAHGPKVQAKFTVSQPQDADEVEAEQMAKKVDATLTSLSSESGVDTERASATMSPQLAVLTGGLQLARAKRDPTVIELLLRSIDFVTTNPDHPALAQGRAPSAITGDCACGGRCSKCAAKRSRQQTPQIGVRRTAVVARQRIARQDGGSRSTWECIKWNLANAGVAGWTIAIIGAVCGAVGAVIGLAGGPAAPATVPTGGATAAAVCLAGVAGLSVGFVLGIITGCLNDSSFQNITTPQAAAEGSPDGGGEVATA